MDKKGGHESISKKKIPTKQAIRDGLKELKNEIKIWTSEVKEKLEMDPILSLPLPGIYS